jgi:hypothetical protein
MSTTLSDTTGLARAESGLTAGNESALRRVVYLLGAGATHGSVGYMGSTRSLIMPGLIETLLERMHEKYIEKYTGYPALERLVNEVVDRSTDFEHLITFLEDSPSEIYRQFSEDLKRIFSTVLRSVLNDVRKELEPRHSELYAVLLDMHEVADLSETLSGFLSLNYDAFLEHAIEERLKSVVDYGLDVRRDAPVDAGAQRVRVLKLHGSFGWKNVWPVQPAAENDPGLWIPPGIRKAKGDYPFNAIWGVARELLDCDVLRIVGCNLGPNDWDLVSLVFTTMHARDSGLPYEVELIGRPSTAARMNRDFPYLRIRSLLEISDIGPQFVAEVLGCGAVDYADLSPEQQALAVGNADAKIRNPFEQWLRIKGELMLQELPSISTRSGIFEEFVVVET